MTHLAPGRQLARFTIVKRLASGGMADVYLAHQSGPSGFTKAVVLKVILPQLAEDQHFIEMFHNEARLAALLNHSSIVQVFDLGFEDDVHFIAMEFVHGINVRRLMGELLERKRRPPLPVALRIVRDVCRALHYAHTLKGPDGRPLRIVHRDVSLENVLVSYSGEVKLADFGIARARIFSASTARGVLKGKIEYMAPEVIDGEPADFRADIYSAGVTLYMLLLGKPPFHGESTAALLEKARTTRPRDPLRVDPELPLPLQRTLLRALEKRPERRHRSAEELAEELDANMAGVRPVSGEDLANLVAAVVPPTSVPQTPSVKRRWPFERMPTVREALPPSDDTKEQITPATTGQPTADIGLPAGMASVEEPLGGLVEERDTDEAAAPGRTSGVLELFGNEPEVITATDNEREDTTERDAHCKKRQGPTRSPAELAAEPFPPASWKPKK